MKHDGNDLLRRQDCIEAIEGITCSMSLCVNADECHGMQRMRKQAVIELANMPAVQPDHNADVSKKVSISYGHENDVISREAAIEALARMMPRSYTPDGSHPADEEIFRAQEVFADCIEALEILPSAQPATNCSEIPNGSDDTISRQAATDALDEQIEQCNKALGSFDISPKDEYAIKVERASLKAYKEQLENMLSVQPEQNGKWIYNSPTTMKCDRCGFAIKDWDWHRFKYCPNCRADMRGGDTE